MELAFFGSPSPVRVGRIGGGGGVTIGSWELLAAAPPLPPYGAGALRTACWAFTYFAYQPVCLPGSIR